MIKAALLLATALAAVLPGTALAEPLLLISIDGLRPGDVLEADKRGLSLPNLRRFLTDGAHASGVTGVAPTLTYPSHTTLMTGVSPARQGMHGYFPGPANLQASLLLMGKSVPRGKNLGMIDMRAIAPTLATIMGASLPDADKPAIDLKP